MNASTRLRRTVLAALSTLTVAGAANAQSASAPARPCQGPEHRQFDFWVGQWDVFVPSGKKAGENRIEVIADGCALLEQWSGSGAVTGKSLSIYDAADKRWHQTWVDNGGTLLMLAGGLIDGSIVMSTAPLSDATGSATNDVQRVTWTPAADGSVRQLWESSTDRGKTWTVLFDGRYVRSR